MHPVWAELAEEKARIVRVARLRAMPQAPSPAYAEARALLAGLRGAARKKVALEVLEMMRGRSWALVRVRPLGFAPAAGSDDVWLVKEGQVLKLDEMLELCARQWSDIFVYLVHESRKLAPADESDVEVRASELAAMRPDHGRSAGGGSKHNNKRGRSAEDNGSEPDSGGSGGRGAGRSAGDVSSASSMGSIGGGSDSDEAALLLPALSAEQIVEIGPACLEAIEARAAVARARGEQAKAKATAAAVASERFVTQLMRTALGLVAGAAGSPAGLDATAMATAAASSFADAGDRLPGLAEKSVTKGLKEQQQELDSLRSELAALRESLRPSRTRSAANDHGRGGGHAEDHAEEIEEALAGATRIAARALGLEGEIGTLVAGKAADLAVWDIERPAELAYWLGKPLLAKRMVAGVWDA